MSRGKRTKPGPSRLLEASRFLMREGDVYDAVRRLAQRLDDEGLDYAVIGGMAVVEHGSKRTTEDIDVLMRGESLGAFRERCLGRGYLPAFPGAKKTFRDAENDVEIKVWTEGPDPRVVSIAGDDFRFVRLETLLDLKLASGLSAPHRLRDVADVQDLIARVRLPLDLSEKLDPSVREEYRRLWVSVNTAPDTEGGV